MAYALSILFELFCSCSDMSTCNISLGQHTIHHSPELGFQKTAWFHYSFWWAAIETTKNYSVEQLDLQFWFFKKTFSLSLLSSFKGNRGKVFLIEFNQVCPKISPYSFKKNVSLAFASCLRKNKTLGLIWWEKNESSSTHNAQPLSRPSA